MYLSYLCLLLYEWCNCYIHTNEWITSVLLMKFIEDFCIAYSSDEKIYGYSPRDLFNSTSLYIVPMVNPDGIDLVTGNLDKNGYVYKNYMTLASNYPDIPFPNGWKANFKGESLINFHLYCQRQQGSGVPNL